VQGLLVDEAVCAVSLVYTETLLVSVYGTYNITLTDQVRIEIIIELIPTMLKDTPLRTGKRITSKSTYGVLES
jgi:hypothetical protein